MAYVSDDPGYEFARDETVTDGVRRIAAGQLDKALAEMDDAGLAPDKRVHQVRKRLKKLRGLVRLARFSLGGNTGYRAENAAFRDAGKHLAPVRDAQVLIETCDKLMTAFAGEVDRADFAPVRRALADRKRRVAGEGPVIEDRLEEVRAVLSAARQRVAGWEIDAGGFAAFDRGLRKTYRRARRAMARAAAQPDAATLHEWRKRAKYHDYHLRLLGGAWPKLLDVRHDDANHLTDLLGEEHDLAVLISVMENEPGSFQRLTAHDRMIELAARRRVFLQREAFALGARLYAEKPKLLAAQLRAHWDAWRGGRETVTAAE